MQLARAACLIQNGVCCSLEELLKCPPLNCRGKKHFWVWLFVVVDVDVDVDGGGGGQYVRNAARPYESWFVRLSSIKLSKCIPYPLQPEVEKLLGTLWGNSNIPDDVLPG